MPKYATIGDYWDEEMVSKVTQLLHEYQDLFLMKFLEMKGILGDIGVLKIPLKSDVKPIKQRPYRLTPKYKEKVRMKLEKMLAARISEAVQEIMSWYTDVSKVPIVAKLNLVVLLHCSQDLRSLLLRPEYLYGATSQASH